MNVDDADDNLLEEIELHPKLSGLTDRAAEFVRDGQSRFRSVDCFDFVPSNHENAWRVLDSLPRGKFCEWGSGFGIVAGLAEMLGFEACGIEIDPTLAEASRQLLRDHNLSTRILTGSYLELLEPADVYYVYSWPGLIVATESRFAQAAPKDARLLICYGQDVLRCMKKRS